MTEPAEQTKAIVDRDDNHVLLNGEISRVVNTAASANIAPTVNPHHDRKFLLPRPAPPGSRRRPDIQVETVFTPDGFAIKRWINIEQGVTKLGTHIR